MVNVREIVTLAAATDPKLVWSSVVGLVSPSPISAPLPFIFISGLAAPVPWSVKLYGFSSESLFEIAISAVLAPVEVGEKRIENVVVPEALTELEGCDCTEN